MTEYTSKFVPLSSRPSVRPSINLLNPLYPFQEHGVAGACPAEGEVHPSQGPWDWSDVMTDALVQCPLGSTPVICDVNAQLSAVLHQQDVHVIHESL